MSEPGPPQRRQRRQAKIDATPKQVARAIFAAVPPPDPSKRRRGRS